MYDRSPNAAMCKQKLLLGEGVEDALCFEALLKHMKLSDDIQVDQYGGKNKMGEGIKGTTGRTGFPKVVSIGITRDCDSSESGATHESESSAFQSVCSALEKAHLPQPPVVMAKSTGVPSVSVMILPGAGRTGMLEDLFLDYVKSLPEFPCVESYFDCVNSKAGRVQAWNTIAKSQAHAFLATLDKPDLRLGEAAAAGYLDFNHPAFDSLKAFIRAL